MREKLPLSNSIITAPAILFAGAGASVPLGLLTSRAFPQFIESSTDIDTTSAKVFSEVLGLLPEGKDDIEGLLEILSQYHKEGEKRTELFVRLQTRGIVSGSPEELQPVLKGLSEMVLAGIVEHVERQTGPGSFLGVACYEVTFRLVSSGFGGSPSPAGNS